MILVLSKSFIALTGVMSKLSANKKLNKDKKQLAFAPSSLILANNFLPVN